MPYAKLLIHAGGGIISRTQQAQQAKNTASVLIGLGGTGIDCLRTIKTQVYARLLPEDSNAVSPEYPRIRFIGVDTDMSSTGAKKADRVNRESVDARMDLDEITEFFSISNPGVGEAVRHERALATRPEMSWYNPRTPPPKVGSAGAGAIRQIGRFMFMDRADAFITTVSQSITDAKMGLINPTVNIHIFAGLSGGTGSGTFLDVCYLIRDLTRGQNVKLFGYFFLPDVNLSVISPSVSSITREMIQRNGYVGLQELDYCMNLPENGGSFTQVYKGGRTVAWDCKPVDMCHLICSADEAGNSIDKPYAYAMNVTAEYVMDFLTAPVDDRFGLESHQANFVGQVAAADGQKGLGVNLAYCVIGAASASLPLREINTYLASELFTRFASIGEAVPTEADVQQLALTVLARGRQHVSEIYDALLDELQEKADIFNLSYYDQDASFVLNGGDEDFTHHYTDQMASRRGILEHNARSMEDPENISSLAGRLRAAMERLIRDVQKGPIFASRCLSASDSHNLVNIIDGLLETNEARLSQVQYERASVRSAYEIARDDFLTRHKRGFLDSDKKRFGDYEIATRQEIEKQLAIAVYTHLGQVLTSFRKQLTGMSSGYYSTLRRVMENLLETFAINRADLQAGVTMGIDSFSTPMLDIRDPSIREILDAEVRRIDIPNKLDEFMELMLTHESEWLQEDEYKITRLVTQFFVQKAFSGYANRSITAYLQDKYRDRMGTDPNNPNLLANFVYRDWIRPLTERASPMFIADATISHSAYDGSSGLATISIPNACAAISLAAGKMNQASNGKWSEKESALTDRIFAMCSHYVLALSSYKLQAQFQNLVYSSISYGLHLYEGGQVPGMRFNDWTQMAPITPDYYLEPEKLPERVRGIVQKARDLYTRARALGVIDADNYICAPTAETVASVQACLSRARTALAGISNPQSAAQARPVYEELTQLQTLPLERVAGMQHDGRAEREVRERVMRDHFVASPCHQLQVEEILRDVEDLVSNVRDTATQLHTRIETVISQTQLMQQYFNALFTGTITVEGFAVYAHRQTLLGEATDKLCQYGPAYPFSDIPVYQGYVSYQQLPKEQRDGIIQTTAQHMNDGSMLSGTAENLKKTILSPRQISGYSMAADAMENQSEIHSFLELLVSRFEAFCLSNNLI